MDAKICKRKGGNWNPKRETCNVGKDNSIKWTPEMEEVRNRLIHSPFNKETWNDEVNKALEHKGHSFFLNIPVCVAGWDSEHSAWKAVDQGDILIQEALPKNYRLIAWYGWGGSGWVAQTKKKR